jgi:hypothetical protein
MNVPSSPRRSRARLLVAAALSVLTAAVAAQAAIAAPAGGIRNGGFETGTFAGWTTAPRTPLEFPSRWFVYSGDVAPLSGAPIPPPPRGRYAAVTDQTGPGSNILHQTFRVPAGESALEMIVWYRNWAGAFFTPRMLVPHIAANQQLRIDLQPPAAGLYRLRAQDVLATVFHTRRGDPAFREPFRLRFDLSRWAGRLVRLRIAEVDNLFFFNAGIDAVRVVGGAGSSIAQLAVTAARAPRASLPAYGR